MTKSHHHTGDQAMPNLIDFIDAAIFLSPLLIAALAITRLTFRAVH